MDSLLNALVNIICFFLFFLWDNLYVISFLLSAICFSLVIYIEYKEYKYLKKSVKDIQKSVEELQKRVYELRIKELQN